MLKIIHFLLLLVPSLLIAQLDVEPNDVFSEANISTTSGPFIGNTDADWQGDLWRLDIAPGVHPVSWTGDACTRFRIVEYISDPALPGFPFSTPGGVSTCPQILSSDQCNVVDNLPGLGSVSTSFTVVVGRFYYCFINPHNCADMPYGAIMPIELKNFSAEADIDKVHLKWTTVSEVNNSKFEIESSLDGVDFRKVGEVDGIGSSTDQNHYQFLLREVLIQTTYFRLKQIDFDGAYEYSKLIALEPVVFKSKKELQLIPNPNNGLFSIQGASLDFNKKTLVQVISTNGEVVFETYSMDLSQKLDLSYLANGVYFVKVINASNVLSSRWIKQ